MLDLISKIKGPPLTPACGYRVYSAIAREVPELHDLPGWGLILGRHHLGIRCEPGLSGLAARLSGRLLKLGDRPLSIEPARVVAVEPYPVLYAGLVIIKDALDLDAIARAAREQLDAAGIDATLSFGERRAITCRDQQIVGYTCAAIAKTPESSIALQTVGIGGKRRMGCGVFVKGAIVPHRLEDL